MSGIVPFFVKIRDIFVKFPKYEIDFPILQSFAKSSKIRGSYYVLNTISNMALISYFGDFVTSVGDYVPYVRL